METKILTEKEVKKTIKDNRIVFREFYLNKKVYGALNTNGEIIAMVPVLQKKQLFNARKIFTPFVVGNNIRIGTKLLKKVVQENSDFLIFADFTKNTKRMFEKAGFKITNKKVGLLRYNTLYRGVIENGRTW